MKWYNSRQFSEQKDLLAFLNRLTEFGVKPECIKISSCSFGDAVYYFHTKDIDGWGVWDK